MENDNMFMNTYGKFCQPMNMTGYGMMNYGMPQMPNSCPMMNMQPAMHKECPYNCNMCRLANSAQPIYMMYNNIHKLLIQNTKTVITSIASVNMGQMPQSITKSDFDKYTNMIMTEMMKQEQIIQAELNRNSTEDTEDRLFACPGCSGLMKNLIGFALISELYNNGIGYII